MSEHRPARVVTLTRAGGRVGQAHCDLGNALSGLGLHDQAVIHHREALPILEAAFGPIHPDVAETLQGLGEALEETGRMEQARQTLERAHAIRVQTLGPDHEDTLDSAESLSDLIDADATESGEDEDED